MYNKLAILNTSANFANFFCKQTTNEWKKQELKPDFVKMGMN